MSGIEAVKSSTPGSCREKIKQALKLVMKGTEAEFHEFNRQFKKEFYTLAFEDVAFPRSVSELTKYDSKTNVYQKGTPIHVRGALIYNKMIESKKLSRKYETIKDGDKIKFCYMKLPNPTQENVLSILNVLPKEFVLEKHIDYETQFEKAYLEPLKIIVNTFGWSTEPVASLRGFFT
jgi:ASC-1-like (ASCH) protein